MSSDGAEARRENVRRAIDWDDLVDAVIAGRSLSETADRLNVAEPVLADRIRYLHKHEKMLLTLACHRLE